MVYFFNMFLPTFRLHTRRLSLKRRPPLFSRPTLTQWRSSSNNNSSNSNNSSNNNSNNNSRRSRHSSSNYSMR